MAYVDRDGSGNIIAVFGSIQRVGQEFLADTDASLIAFQRGRKPRALYLIYNDLAALTATQKSNIWNDLNSGSPHKYLQDAESGEDSIAALEWSAVQSGAPAAAIADAKLRVAAIYVRDNPKYLLNPSFDTTINIAGDVAR